MNARDGSNSIPQGDTIDMKSLFDLVIVKRSSDLLLTAGAPPLLRLNGELKATEYPELSPEDNKRLIYSILSDKQKEEFEETRELDMSIGVSGGHRFRVNVYMQKGCVTAAMRAIPEQMPTLEHLGLPKIAAKLAFRPQGLILVTGPTGHGKTTTQAAMIDLINAHKRCHIITVEDPIEYVHHHKKSVVDQRELGSDTLSFAGALKYVLRQDPDVILIGEMRDLETISSALTAAETGHLVLGTLPRLRDIDNQFRRRQSHSRSEDAPDLQHHGDAFQGRHDNTRCLDKTALSPGHRIVRRGAQPRTQPANHRQRLITPN
jgi:twitching motility protein PilT